MNDLITLSDDLHPLIARTNDNSNPIMRRVLVEFVNGYSLSIVRGSYSYGGDRGLFEIAPINQLGELDGDLLDEEHQGDDVLGHCDLNTINHYIRKLAYLPVREEP